MITLNAISTTKDGYIDLSVALREVILLIHLISELKQKGFPIHAYTPKITYLTFEYIHSCNEILTKHKTQVIKNRPLSGSEGATLWV